ncbi:Hypothetical protein SMAX5B_000690 [Scophthalmus maximus]|uniref:Uncharacterized protein n=1 Tax=Scophthalmus maximus TaxID=52904 RepID=A0A2U9B6C8_SCOMX|nr:Hypothetical protein SMAX5B_000690 [Scophthalmus maximus]
MSETFLPVTGRVVCGPSVADESPGVNGTTTAQRLAVTRQHAVSGERYRDLTSLNIAYVPQRHKWITSLV